MLNIKDGIVVFEIWRVKLIKYQEKHVQLKIDNAYELNKNLFI